MIADRRNNSFIGFISLGDMNRYDGYMEMEYAIATEYRNKGYAAQAVKQMLDYELRKHARDKSDTICYSILREEWERISSV